jgi:hypothetical protein
MVYQGSPYQALDASFTDLGTSLAESRIEDERELKKNRKKKIE